MIQRQRTLPQASITEGSIPKALLYFFFPILFGSFFQQLYNTADAIIVGRFVGKEALAAAGAGSAVFVNLLVGFFVGLSNGAAIVISQAFGSRDKQRVKASIETSMLMSIIGGAIVMVAGLLCSGWAMRIIGTPADILDLSIDYLRIYFVGMIPMFVYNMGSSALRSMGDSKSPLIILIISCMSNIVLDILFVAVFNMGVQGAAWATVLCMCISAWLVLLKMSKNPVPEFRFTFNQLHMEKDIFLQMLYLGIPAGIQGSMYNISNIIIQAGINTFGTTVVAGNAAYGKIDSLFWMCVNSFGVAMTVFAGQNYGAKHDERIKKGNWICVGMCAGMAVFFSLLYLRFGRTFLKLFTLDDDVLDAGMVILRTIAPAYITYILIEIMSGTIRGCGSSIVPTLLTVFGVCIFRIFWMFVVIPHHNDIVTLMWVYPVSWILTSTLFLLYYRFGHWLKPHA